MTPLGEWLADPDEIELALERKELADLLHRALALLPAQTRDALLAHYLEEAPLAQIAERLGVQASAVAVRLQRGRLALRRLLTTELGGELAAYRAGAESGVGWEETRLWCTVCGQRRLLGRYDVGGGELWLRCPGCCVAADDFYSHTHALEILGGVRGYQRAHDRLIAWIGRYYPPNLRAGVVPCQRCGRLVPLGFEPLDYLAPSPSGNNRGLHHWCPMCDRDCWESLDGLLLASPDGVAFTRRHTHVRTLPQYEIETDGRAAVVARFESVTESDRLVLVAAADSYELLRVERASVVSDLASCIAVALIPLLYATIGLPFWALLALVFCAGLLTTPGATARSALVPDLASLAGARMEQATALTDGISRLSRFIGAPLAGVLIALVGTSNLLWIDAATFGASALLIGLLVPHHLPVTAHGNTRSVTAEHAPWPAAAPTRRRLFGNARDGISFIAHDPVLASTLLVVLVTNMLDAGYGAVLAPAWVKQIYGSPVVLGMLIAAFGGAAFLGAIIFGAVGHRLPRRLTLGWGYTIGGAVRLFWVVLLARTLPVLVITQAICGFCIGPINPLFSTIEFERVPAEKRARVFGAGTAGSMLATPLGGLLAGGVAAAIGTWPCILVFGVVYALATASLLVNPALHNMGSPHPGMQG